MTLPNGERDHTVETDGREQEREQAPAGHTCADQHEVLPVATSDLLECRDAMDRNVRDVCARQLPDAGNDRRRGTSRPDEVRILPPPGTVGRVHGAGSAHSYLRRVVDAYDHGGQGVRPTRRDDIESFA